MSPDLREQLQQTLSGAYSLERELGGGGMSRVFVAEESRLHRKVVVKVLSPELAAGVSAERFEREIQVAASLQQANIVPLLSAGETNGLPYFTMPFVEGESLRARLAKGPLSVTEVVSVLRDVARALSYAHEHGVVHRDIKPDNVLLSHGTAVVTDFGIAKALSASRTKGDNATLTQLGTSIGTPAYMAPEQAAGDTDIDSRADIYAFGCMAFELLAGHPPFHGRTPTRVLAAQMGEAPPSVSDLRPDSPAVLAELVMRCLEKNPDDRPQSAADLSRVLDTVTSGGGMQALPAVLLAGKASLLRALLVYALAFAGIALVAKAAIIVIGLPSWVLPGAVIVMALGLPMILFTAYVQRATRRVLTATPTLTLRGTQPAPAGTMVTMALKASPHVSWRRTTVGGLVALGAFVVLVAGYMVLRMLGIGPEGSLMAAGELANRDEVLIADFAVPNADSSLSSALTQALRSQLEQSSAIRVMPASEVATALEEMRRPADSPVDLDVARDLGVRRGIKAIVAADAAPLPGGGGYLVTIRLVNTKSGDVLASYQETASSAAGLLGAIDGTTRKLRARIGESLRTIQAEPPLEEATTSSLEALRKYAEGVRANDVNADYAGAIRALQQAVAIDSNFGIAYRKLSLAYFNGGASRALQREAIERAYALRDRMPSKERALAMGVYFATPPHVDRARRAAAYEEAFRLDPGSYVAAGNLALVALLRRDWSTALHFAVLARDLEPASPFNLEYQSNALIDLGRLDEAARVVDSVSSMDSAGAGRIIPVLLLAAARGNYDSLEAFLRPNLGSSDPNRSIQDLPSWRGLMMLRGRFQEAERAVASLQVALAPSTRADSAPARLGAAFVRATLDVDLPGAIALADSVAAASYLSGIPLPERPYLDLVTFFARAGDTTRAQAMLDQYDAEIRDTVLLHQDASSRHGALGEIALAENRPDDAMREFRRADVDPDGFPAPCALCLDVNLGRAFDIAGQADSAIAAFQRYLRTPFHDRLGIAYATSSPYYSVPGLDAAFRAPVLKRLGELYEAKGDRDDALTAYTQFVELWKNADPPLQPTVTEVRQRIARLQRAEGR